MTTYLPILLESGRWAIEPYVDGESQCFTFGRYNDEKAASFVVHAFERMAAKEEASSRLLKNPLARRARIGFHWSSD